MKQIKFASILFVLAIFTSPTWAVAPSTPPGSSATTTTFTSSTTPIVITNNNTVSDTITVSGAGTYLFDLDMTTFITHTFSDDLDITLTSPAGTVVTITTDNGEANDNVFNGTVWDDDGGTPVTDYTYSDNVLASPLVPEEAFGAFIGEDPNGVWTLAVGDDASGDQGSLADWSLDVTTITPVPITNTSNFPSTTVPVAIPTGPAVVSDTITVSGAGTYLFDLDMTTFITHTFAADLDITLTSPAGTVVTITTDNGAVNDNVFNGTVWDDDAGTPVTDYVYANNVLASPLVPEEAFGAFIGEDPNGVWTLTVRDDVAGDGGSLADWSLDIVAESSEYASTPAPGSIALNTTVDGPTSATITVSETGVADLDVISANLTGDAEISLTTNPAPFTIADDSGTTQDIVVTCASTTIGTYNATLEVSHNAPASPATYSITCNVLASTKPVYVSDPAIGPIALQSMLNVPVEQTITVSEAGGSDLTITAISVTGNSEISLTSNPAPFTIVDDSGTTQDFVLTCNSAAAGTFNATLEVVHNGDDSPALYNITCAIDEPIYISDPAVGLISLQTTMDTPISEIITISEAGSADLTISAINLTGNASITLASNPAPFTITNDSGATQDIVIVCESENEGVFTATLEVTHGADGSPALYPIICVAEPESSGSSASGAAPSVGVFDPALSKIGLLVPGQTGVAGEQLEWVVTVSNTGDGAGSNVTITDDVDSRLQINDVDAPGATVNINGQTVSVTYATINPGESYQFSIFTTVLQGVTINNTVCVSGSSVCTTGSAVDQLPSTGESPWWRKLLGK